MTSRPSKSSGETPTRSSPSCGAANRWLSSGTERYLIDITKIAIKDPGVQPAFKFHALLLLKEVSKGFNKAFVEYLDKKLLLRLFKIASTSPPKDCLKEYSKNPAPADAEKFYFLLRECFNNWSGLYKDINKNYPKYAQSLGTRQRMQIPKKYWDFPADTFPLNPQNGFVAGGQLPALGQNPPNNLSPINTSGLSGNAPNPGQPLNPNNNANNPQVQNARRIAEVGRIIRKPNRRTAARKDKLCQLPPSTERPDCQGRHPGRGALRGLRARKACD